MTTAVSPPTDWRPGTRICLNVPFGTRCGGHFFRPISLPSAQPRAGQSALPALPDNLPGCETVSILYPQLAAQSWRMTFHGDANGVQLEQRQRQDFTAAFEDAIFQVRDFLAAQRDQEQNFQGEAPVQVHLTCPSFHLWALCCRCWSWCRSGCWSWCRRWRLLCDDLVRTRRSDANAADNDVIVTVLRHIYCAGTQAGQNSPTGVAQLDPFGSQPSRSGGVHSSTLAR